MAEDGGFEPPRVLSQHDFQSCALGHYANPPRVRLLEGEPPPEIVAQEPARCHDRRVGTTPEPSDAVAGTGTDPAARAATSVGSIPPLVAKRLAEPSILDRVRSVLARATSRQVLGWVLAVGWVLWLVATWVTQPRIVPPDFVAADLARGDVTAYRLVTVDQAFGRGPFSSAEGIDVYAASDDQDGVIDGAADGRPLTIAYWVDAPVADLRVLDTNGLSSDTPAALVETFRAAGVPEAEASRLYRGLPSDRVANAGAVLLFVGFLAVVLGPRPRRGTRWFWFWIVGGPLSVGLPIFAVAELLRPRYEAEGTVHPPGVAGRWSGLAGFALGLVLSLALGWMLLTLSGLSPVWLVRA